MNSATWDQRRADSNRSSASQPATYSRQALREAPGDRIGSLASQPVKPAGGAAKPVGGAKACEGPSRLTAQPTAAAVSQRIEVAGATRPSSSRFPCAAALRANWPATNQATSLGRAFDGMNMIFDRFDFPEDELEKMGNGLIEVLHQADMA